MNKTVALPAQAKTSGSLAAHTTQLKHPTSDRHPAVVSACVSSPLVDGLKFKVISRGGKHYFKNVRFKSEELPGAESRAVAEFFEGRCLENLTREGLSAYFNRAPLLASLQEVVADLQHVLCD